MLHLQTRLFGVLLAWLLFAGICAAGELDGKIAVAADAQETTGQISMEAGHAAYYLIFDMDGNLLEAARNPHAEAARGAGRSTAHFLAEKKVTVVVAGRFGPKMAATLRDAHIKYIEKQGSVIDAAKGVEHAR
ncbi:MAG: hypothetical protein KAK02_08035 [Desulfobulbaceae bacterium]|nr:hypothetical protein [Desulfobulbaceae bacterium]